MVLGTNEISNASDADYRISFDSESLGFEFDFAEGGNITVTRAEGNIVEGTFEATITNDAEETIEITNGSFRGVSSSE